MNDITKNLPGLYIHIPFCVSKCPYCNFYSITDQSALPAWIDALRLEMTIYADEFDTFDTIYLGGGTPSTLSPKALSSIIDDLYRTFSMADNGEFTMEANPGDMNDDVLSFIRDTPINRVNLGVQSFDDDILAYLGRRHDSKKARQALSLLRKKGGAHIGIDLIYGVPAQSMESWMTTLEEALRYKPEHLSCYELTVETDTPLGQRLGSRSEELVGEEQAYSFFMTTSERLEEAGYIHYEVSNFALREELRSRHNMKYWNHTPYLGLGPSAHSLKGNRRWWNFSSLERYIDDLRQNLPPVENSETLDEEDLRLERIFLGLRTKEGIDGNEFSSFDPVQTGLLRQCMADGLLERRDNRIIPTRRGLALADQLAAAL